MWWCCFDTSRKEINWVIISCFFFSLFCEITIWPGTRSIEEQQRTAVHRNQPSVCDLSICSTLQAGNDTKPWNFPAPKHQIRLHVLVKAGLFHLDCKQGLHLHLLLRAARRLKCTKINDPKLARAAFAVKKKKNKIIIIIIIIIIILIILIMIIKATKGLFLLLYIDVANQELNHYCFPSFFSVAARGHSQRTSELTVNDIWNKSYMNCGNEMKMKKWSS